MKNEIINEIIVEIMEEISSEATEKLKNILLVKLHGFEIVKHETEISTEVYDNQWIMERFAIDQMAKGLKKSTIQQYLWIMKKFFADTNLNYRYVQGQNITDYLALRQYKDGITRNYKCTILRYMSAFFTWAYRKKHIETDIMLDVDSIKVIQKTKQKLSDEEVEICRTLAAESNEKAAVLETMLSTGMRVGEIKCLKISDLDFKEGTIKIWGEKSSKERTGFMTPKFKVAVQRYLNGRRTGYLFQNKSGGSRTESWYECIAKELAVAAGSEIKATVHVYRKTFASTMYRKTRDALLVSKLLGHASTETTAKYYLIDDIEDMKYRVQSAA